jgi:hypothetical protein
MSSERSARSCSTERVPAPANRDGAAGTGPSRPARRMCSSAKGRVSEDRVQEPVHVLSAGHPTTCPTTGHESFDADLPRRDHWAARRHAGAGAVRDRHRSSAVPGHRSRVADRRVRPRVRVRTPPASGVAGEVRRYLQVVDGTRRAGPGPGQGHADSGARNAYGGGLQRPRGPDTSGCHGGRHRRSEHRRMHAPAPPGSGRSGRTTTGNDRWPHPGANSRSRSAPIGVTASPGSPRAGPMAARFGPPAVRRRSRTHVDHPPPITSLRSVTSWADLPDRVTRRREGA